MPRENDIAVVHHSPAGATGRPVLLIHGFASDWESDFGANGWVEALAGSGARVSTVDLPGHARGPAVGSVEAGATSRVLEYLVAAVEEVADHYGAGAVDVLGYSLGARLAWELPAAGARVGRLVLGGLGVREPFAAVDVQELRNAVAGSGEVADPLVGMLSALVGAPGKDSESLVNLVGGLGSEPFDPDSAAPATEVLFIAGEEDFMTAGIEGIVGLVGSGELRKVPGDHHGALAAPEFRDLATAFLGRAG
ncbi:alpha/beta fold hydrolase [Paeniglutamicibacter sp. R2-26]|uniref:alpha/beta fold hydrolase n=1 Tax=Paeniglutamicibacter sp. R2-26 TaxID=3144417 RepID=UPI003EE5168A